MTTLWIDCKYGIAGDMLLSALIDLGADEDYISSQLNLLSIDAFEMFISKKNVHGIQANYLNLRFESDQEVKQTPHDTEYIEELHDTHHHHLHQTNDEVSHHLHEHHHRSASDIYHLIQQSELSQRVKEQSIALFKEIARAEGKIHGVSAEAVHFHEVGAMDSIIDIVGVCIALDYLGVDHIIATAVPTGSGMLKMAHGLYPIPAPATSEILVGVPLSNFEAAGELTTPTGAAFLKVLVNEFDEKPSGIIEKVGYGAGTKEFSHPNILRVMQLKK